MPRDARVRLPISSLAPPIQSVVVFTVVDWAVSVRNCTGPLADRKAGRSHALVDNLDDDHNHDIGDVVEVPRN